ncbi:hypothetical protein PVK06_008550 [Gossypium arboreum]|uniref:Uncharacterized protein n=1 Tax=Gossypium arboreum TaxID=29729 RepID=A0ABR0QL65_GOSAR|nr:hypothetical protein PVK06_008550 [Gossypium arboreum]
MLRGKREGFAELTDSESISEPNRVGAFSWKQSPNKGIRASQFSCSGMEFSLVYKRRDRFKKLKEDFRGKLKVELQGQLHGIFKQYLGKLLLSDKGKGVLSGPPPRFPLKDSLFPFQNSDVVKVNTKPPKLDCPRFDCTKFRGW